MTITEFIRALKIQTSDAAVSGTLMNLIRPPGRKPKELDVALSRWYLGLTSRDQDSVNIAMREAAELAVFSFLCVLDGVSAIENGPEKGDLRLIYSKNGVETLLNDQGRDFLHNLYNTLCQNSDQITPDQNAFGNGVGGPSPLERADC